MMDPKKSQQTTQGIWISKIPNEKTLVFDVEGSDSSERGKDGDVRFLLTTKGS